MNFVFLQNTFYWCWYCRFWVLLAFCCCWNSCSCCKHCSGWAMTKNNILLYEFIHWKHQIQGCECCCYSYFFFHLPFSLSCCCLQLSQHLLMFSSLFVFCSVFVLFVRSLVYVLIRSTSGFFFFVFFPLLDTWLTYM